MLTGVHACFMGGSDVGISCQISHQANCSDLGDLVNEVTSPLECRGTHHKAGKRQFDNNWKSNNVKTEKDAEWSSIFGSLDASPMHPPGTPIHDFIPCPSPNERHRNSISPLFDPTKEPNE